MTQNQNINASLNIIDILGFLIKSWTRPVGLFVLLTLEFAVYLFFGRKLIIEEISGNYIIVGVAVMVIATIVMWLLTSKRVLFRNNIIATLVFLIASALALWFYYKIYPVYIAKTQYSWPYLQYWGAFLAFLAVIVLGILVYKLLPKGKKLFIVFTTASGSVRLENKLKESIKNIIDDIENEVDSVRLQMIPFGVIKNVKAADRYIKRAYTSADAIIFATVIEETEGNHVEYLFDKFTSRINERRFPKNEINDRIDLGVVTTQNRSKTWNYINAANDNCSRTKVIMDNLKDMLQMYVGGILLMRQRFADALPLMETALKREYGNEDTYALASQLYTYAILSSAKELETDQQDYDSALNQLTRCASKVPAALSHPGYNKAMARVMFYKGKLKASVEYTKKFKYVSRQEWGYELNMGFYALYEKCVPEFVRRYKRLLKFKVYEKEEVRFAIDFLEHQSNTTNDNKYKTLLKVAIAYLYMYQKRRKAIKMISNVDYSKLPQSEVKELDRLKEIIESDNETLQIVGRKSN